MAIQHKHILIRGECFLAPGPQDELKIFNKVVKLIKDIDMNVFMEPKVKYMPDVGNEGLTYVAGLETSHTSAHFWDSPAKDLLKYQDSTLVQKDLYTCGNLDINQVKVILTFLEEFQPKLINAAIYDRSKHDTFDEALVKIKFDYKDKIPYKDFVNSLEFNYNKE